MPLTPAPGPYTTNDGSLIGAVNGSNTTYTALSNPILLLYSLTGVTGSSLLFRNGLLQDPADYIEGSGYFGLPTPVGTGTIAARVFQGGAVTRLNRTNGGLIFNGTRSFHLVAPAAVNRGIEASTIMLFRNGLLLLNGTDYTVPVPRVFFNLSAGSAYVTGDVFTAVLDTGGVRRGLTGAINGVNATFTFNTSASFRGGSPQEAMVFLNGKYQREGYDYQRTGPQIVFASPVPQTGDTLTARLYGAIDGTDPVIGPVQITTSNGSLFYPPAVAGLVFVNGLLMTQGLDAALNGNVVTLARAPLPG